MKLIELIIKLQDAHSEGADDATFVEPIICGVSATDEVILYIEDEPIA